MLEYSISSSIRQSGLKKNGQITVNSVIFPFPKRGENQQCNNNRTIALISHSRKMLFKIIASRMKTKLREKTVDEQAGFRTVQVKKSNIKCEHDHRKE